MVYDSKKASPLWDGRSHQSCPDPLRWPPGRASPRQRLIRPSRARSLTSRRGSTPRLTGRLGRVERPSVAGKRHARIIRGGRCQPGDEDPLCPSAAAVTRPSFFSNRWDDASAPRRAPRRLSGLHVSDIVSVSLMSP